MFETDQAANAVEPTDGLATQEPDQKVEPEKPVAPDKPDEPEKPEDISQTKAFSERLKKSIDAEYAKLYGQYGINSKAEYEDYVVRQQEEERQQKLIEQGIDPDALKEAVASDPDVQWARTFREKQEVENFRAQAKDEKASLKDEPYFSDLEAEIDTLIETSLQQGKMINPGTAYRFLVGQNIKDLITRSKDQTAKQTLANVQDRANRGLTGGSDFSVNDIDYSDVDSEMARAFGNDPKDIAEYKAKQKRR